MPLIQESLFNSAAEYPDKEAVVCGDRRISYQDLEKASNQLASFLLSIGLKRGDRIGIFSAKCVEEVIAIFAVLKAGGVFIHVNPQFKERQLAHVLDDCGIGVLLVHPAKARILSKPEVPAASLRHVIALAPDLDLPDDRFSELHALSDVLRDGSPDPVANELGEDDTASIIYTSGSTGPPKGVIVTHRIFHDSTVASVSVLANHSGDRLISVTPLSFDGALSQLFTAFHVGGSLVQQPSAFPQDIVATLLAEGITGFHSVPSLWGLLLSEQSPLARHEYPHLRYVSIIGEVVPRRLLAELRRLLPGTRIYVMYGTTEAFRSTYLVAGEATGKDTSVGRPFPGVEISIEDANGAFCAAGQVGEIVHRGTFVSPGYWNDTGESDEIFDGNAVRTGDLGYLDEDGYLYFEGRRDAMIKIQGYRVSPEEVEECLYEIPVVNEAAVVAVDAPNVGLQLKAVIACKAASALSEADVIKHCRRLLPYYMVPGIVEFRSALPRTASNKIQRSTLV
jgi:amino acid adenylation domain-containing protein